MRGCCGVFLESLSFHILCPPNPQESFASKHATPTLVAPSASACPEHTCARESHPRKRSALRPTADSCRTAELERPGDTGCCRLPMPFRPRACCLAPPPRLTNTPHRRHSDPHAPSSPRRHRVSPNPRPPVPAARLRRARTPAPPHVPPTPAPVKAPKARRPPRPAAQPATRPASPPRPAAAQPDRWPPPAARAPAPPRTPGRPRCEHPAAPVSAAG